MNLNYKSKKCYVIIQTNYSYIKQWCKFNKPMITTYIRF